VPQIIIPHIADQPFWAREVIRLGAGKRLNRRFWPERIYDMVCKVTQNETMKARCQEIREILKNEDGPANASLIRSNPARIFPFPQIRNLH